MNEDIKTVVDGEPLNIIVSGQVVTIHNPVFELDTGDGKNAETMAVIIRFNYDKDGNLITVGAGDIIK